MKLTKKDILSWTKALRSGEYAQGTRQLCQNFSTDPDKQKFCCLGVACDLFLDDYWEEDTDGNWLIDGEHALPPPKLKAAIVDALSFNSKVLSAYMPEYVCEGLSDCNDEAGLNFHEIADLVEQAAGIKKATKR